MTESTAPITVAPSESDAVTPAAHSSNCPICGIPELPCPRCNPKPKVLPEKGSFPTRIPGVVVR